MAQHTSTIRVPTDTRDELARQARLRGVSLARMLTDIATENQRNALFASERAAQQLDATNPLAAAESQEWDDIVDDGLV